MRGHSINLKGTIPYQLHFKINHQVLQISRRRTSTLTASSLCLKAPMSNSWVYILCIKCTPWLIGLARMGGCCRFTSCSPLYIKFTPKYQKYISTQRIHHSITTFSLLILLRLKSIYKLPTYSRR